MYYIQTEYGNFGKPRDLYLFMKQEGIKEVTATSYYIGDPVCTTHMTIEKVKEWLHENKPNQYIVSSGWCVFIMTIEEAKKRNMKKWEHLIVK